MAISTVFIVATFRRYSQQFEQKLCLLPGDEWWRDRAHTAAEQNVLSAPPPPSLSPVCALRSAECVCAVHGSSGCCRGRECAGPSPTRMGETAPRRCKQQDHRPIAFSGKRWSAGVALVPSPVQCPHTCRPGLLAAEKFWVLSAGSARLQWGVCAGWRLGPGGVESRWPAGGSTHCFHWFPGVTHHSTGGGRGEKRGRGSAPKCRQVSPKC